MPSNSLTKKPPKRKPRNFTLSDNAVKLMDKQRKRTKLNRSRHIEHLIFTFDRGEQN